MNPKTAEKIQNEIWRKMPPVKKIKIVSEIFELMEKLSKSKSSKPEAAKQLEDIKPILKIPGIDLNYIKKWAKSQSTIEILKSLV